MIDTTKISSVQQNLLKAMEVMSTQSLKEVSFDKTVLCTIENNDDKKDGKYKVSDGTTTYTAYSSVTNYNVGTAVYVTIPEGNYNNQKIIIGKKTTTDNSPYVIEQPFDAIFDLTGNLCEGSDGERGLTANASKGSVTIAEIDNLELAGYSKLGLKAGFRTYLSEAVKGRYGLQAVITFKTDEGKERNESFELNNSEMFGNPYNFETYYEQQEVVDIENLGIITKIKIDLYQNKDFYDKNTQYLKCSTDGYKTDSEKRPIIGKDGFYIPEGEILGDNICVKDLFICAGDDASKFTTDYVELYTKDSKHYNKSDKQKEKTVNMRWIHVGNTKTDMVAAAEKETIPKEDTYEIRWYRYSIGVAAADEYCGVYWDRINPANGERIYWYNGKDEEEYLTEATALKTKLDSEEITQEEYDKEIAELDKQYEAKSYWYSETVDNIELDLHSFSCKFTPNYLKNNEKIKVIAFYNGVAYRGKAEMLFENDEEVFDASSAIFVNALQIVPADNTNGNYLIYGQNAQLQDSEESKKTRTLTAYFDTNSDGTAESLIQPDENLTWIFPVESTMIKVLSETIKEYKEVALSVDDWQSGRYYYEEYKEITLAVDDWVSGKYYYKENEEYKLDTSIEKTAERQYYEKAYILDSSDTFVIRNYYKLVDTGEVKDKSINPIYSIDKTYSSSKSNNTVYCRYTLEGITYTSEKEFTFGPKGTMGTDQTIVIDFVGDNNAIVMGDGQDTYKLQVQLYDDANLLRTDISNVTWDWYYRSSKGLSLSDTSSSVVTITKDKDCLSIDDLFILKVTVGELETYFPLPIKKLGYSYITGPTQVIYKADGSADYSKEAYSIYDTSLDINWRTRFDIQNKDDNGNIILPAKKYYLTADGAPWYFQGDIWEKDYVINNEGKIKFNDNTVERQARYIGNVENNDNEYKLKPLAIYVEDSLIYGVQACYENYVLWTQPVLVLQNKWASNVINKWDGKSLVLDETNSNIIASSIAAGKKNSDNTFSGVMMGDWSGTDNEGSVTEHTGIYGFDKGAMSYAFKDDGTAFLGKDGQGRIEFNGNKAQIASSTKTLNNNSGEHSEKFGSMVIDLNDPYIKMESTSGNISIDASQKGVVTRYMTKVTNQPFAIGDNFAVDWTGTLFAKNGYFKGQLTGDYGSIGSWIIVPPDINSWSPTELKEGANAGAIWYDEKRGEPIGESKETYKDDRDYAGVLRNSSKTVFLNPQDKGSLILGSTEYNRIVIDAGGSGTIKMGRDSVLESGILSSVEENEGDIRLRGAFTLQHKVQSNGSFTWQRSGIMGEMTGDFYQGNDQESFTEVNTDGYGIGFSVTDGGQIKATNNNAGMSYGNYYFSLQQPPGETQQKLIMGYSGSPAKGFFTMDDVHVGLSFKTNSFLSLKDTVGDLLVSGYGIQLDANKQKFVYLKTSDADVKLSLSDLANEQQAICSITDKIKWSLSNGEVRIQYDDSKALGITASSTILGHGTASLTLKEDSASATATLTGSEITLAAGNTGTITLSGGRGINLNNATTLQGGLTIKEGGATITGPLVIKNGEGRSIVEINPANGTIAFKTDRADQQTGIFARFA